MKKEQKYSVAIANAIAAFLRDDHWHYKFDEKEGVYHTNVQLESGLNHIDVHIQVYDDSFSVNAISPINVKKDPAKRKEMAEFICRANYGLCCGAFQYDIRNGEILYKVFVLCQNIIPSPEMVKYSLYIPALMFDKYADGILAILFAGANAKDAVIACEVPDDS